MTTLLLEPVGGLAGDMLLAALLDLDDPRFTLDDLRGLVERLLPGEAQLEVETVWRGGLSGRALTVRTAESGTTPHRGLRDLLALVHSAGLPSRVGLRIESALTALAEAEGRVHGCSPEEVHFHEVGAVDTLVDLAGAALALDALGIDEVLATPPLLGSGTVHCAHGEMPVPAPAVAELLRGRATRLGGGCERTTPTGAAVLVAWSQEAPASLGFRSAAVGYGAGSRDPKEGPPNLVRVQLGEQAQASGAHEPAWLLEVNLDDMTGEDIGHLLGRLREAGALEAWSSSVHMKKDRPGTVVSVLCRESQKGVIEETVFTWSTTLGVRWSSVERTERPRRQCSVEVEGHAVRVKLRFAPGALEPDGAFAEFDDVARAAAQSGVPLRVVREQAERLARESFV